MTYNSSVYAFRLRGHQCICEYFQENKGVKECYSYAGFVNSAQSQHIQMCRLWSLMNKATNSLGNF